MVGKWGTKTRATNGTFTCSGTPNGQRPRHIQDARARRFEDRDEESRSIIGKAQ
jgi:hypothetical protein